jgi:adenylate cyclase class IV
MMTSGERMHVDVKILLASKHDADIVRRNLQSALLQTELQDNHFFDTPNRALITQGSLLRVRHSTVTLANSSDAATSESAIVALKEHAHVESGSQVVWAGQDAISPEAARCLLHRPEQLLDSSLLPRVAPLLAQLQLPLPLLYIGSFQNIRAEFQWPGCRSQPGLTIRLDETTFPFKVQYELEVSGIYVPVHDVIDELTAVLEALQVSFSLGSESKFVTFVRGIREANSVSHMIQEVKIRLNSEDDMNKFAAVIANDFVAEDTQENFFFDGANGELSGKMSFFRVRVKNDGQTTVGAVKEHQEVEGGTQVCWTQETPINPVDAAMLLTNPRDVHQTTRFLSQSQSPLAAVLREKFHVTALHFVGSFRTHRATYTWSSSASQPVGLILKLDKTRFPFGNHFEIEVSQISVPVQDVLDELAGWLTRNGISFAVSMQSKLECFMEGCQRNFMNPHNVVV